MQEEVWEKQERSFRQNLIGRRRRVIRDELNLDVRDVSEALVVQQRKDLEKGRSDQGMMMTRVVWEA